MMWLWFGAAALVAATMILMLRGLAAPKSAEARDPALVVFTDQLAEIDRDLAAGTLASDEADMARQAVRRRILGLDRRAPSNTAAPKTAPRLLAVGLVGLLPLSAFGLYAWQGAPHLPAQPFAQRTAADPTELDTALAPIQAQIAADPEDPRGHVLLAETLRGAGRFREALVPLDRALALTGPDPLLLMARAETLVAAEDGIVVASAEQGFATAAAARPDDPRPLYYLGLAAAQRGDDRLALEIWARAAPLAPPGSTLAEALVEQAARAEVRLAEAPARGPTAEQMQEGAQMAPADQQAMIATMVGRLAARLAENPGDIDG